MDSGSLITSVGSLVSLRENTLASSMKTNKNARYFIFTGSVRLYTIGYTDNTHICRQADTHKLE